jgi:hypothetical protein
MQDKDKHARLTREYRKVRARQLAGMTAGHGYAAAGAFGSRGIARAALEYARTEIALQDAEHEDRIRFNWQPDPEPDCALDQSWESDEQRAEYARELESGAIEVLTCDAEVPAGAELETCPHCGHELGWRSADGMSSIGCVDLRVGDPDSDAYRREVEHDLAFEAGVIS